MSTTTPPTSHAARAFAYRFVPCLFLTAIVVVGIGWLTSFREVMHTALITVAVFAFLPFIFVLIGFGLLMLFVVVSALAAAFGGGAAAPPSSTGLEDLGIAIAPYYYRWLARRRHPVFWGIPIGVLLGGLTLWGLLAWLIIPGESRTVITLTQTQQALSRYHAEHSSYPKPDAYGALDAATLGLASSGVVLDGFGRPIRYERKGAWKMSSYTLRSYGFDGKPGRDDFCLSDSTTLARWADAIKINRGPGRLGISITLQLQGIQDMRCRN